MKFRLAIWILGIVCIAWILSSCNHSVVYQSNSSVNEKGWLPTDSLVFAFSIDEINRPLNFYFNVRNTTDYPYQNLYLFITTRYPNGTYSRDTAECIFATPEGKWLGKGNGRIKDSRFIFKRNLYFPQKGDYIIVVNHGMRENSLKGIHDLGIEISKPKEK